MSTSRVTVLILPLLALACGSDPKPPAAAPTGGTDAPSATATAAGTGAAPADKEGDDPARGNLAISDEIRKACGLTEAEAFFAFDSANVRPQDRAILRKLADCFAKGPLQGRVMRLVGHADPRGDSEYNMVLGGRRAGNVQRVLVAEGMASGKVTTTSRGAMDATGTDEASWARDRRVDVVLGD